MKLTSHNPAASFWIKAKCIHLSRACILLGCALMYNNKVCSITSTYIQQVAIVLLVSSKIMAPEPSTGSTKPAVSGLVYLS